jgi:hypothetical protein
MRSQAVFWVLTALLTSAAIAAPPSREKGAAMLAEEAIQGETPAAATEEVKYTTFNDVKVPPMLEIEGEKFDEVVKDGYW